MPAKSKLPAAAKPPTSMPNKTLKLSGVMRVIPIAPKADDFWDEEEETPSPPPKMQSKPATRLETASLPELTAPLGYFAIGRPSGVRLLILDRAGADWNDILCYNYEMHVTMHVKREDLYPKDAVDAAIEFANKLRQ